MKVAVVGGCASGKTTITERLSRKGYEAYVVGQEHSEVPDLWRRRSPDALVYLEVSLAVVRQRRDRFWPEWLYHRQRERMENARREASVIVDTGEIDVDAAVEIIVQAIETDRPG